MERLTKEQELRLIQALYDNDDFIGNGGGRMVFHLPYQFINELGLSTFRDYIVKVALGASGLSQNILECDTYERFHKEIALAEIVCAGAITEIMEEVDTDLSNYIYDYYDEYECCDEEGISELLHTEFDMAKVTAWNTACEIANLMEQLTDLNGSTADNAQIGYNSRGNVVAYDYGYTRDKTTADQCSETRAYVDTRDNRYLLLNYILELGTSATEEEWNDAETFMATVEDEFFTYLRETADVICCYEDDDECSEDEVVYASTYHSPMVQHDAGKSLHFWNETHDLNELCDLKVEFAEGHWQRCANTADHIEQFCNHENFFNHSSPIFLTKWEMSSII